MERHQFGNFNLSWNEDTGDLRLMAKGTPKYKPILGRAFPSLYFSRSFEDRFGIYDWGTYIKGSDAEGKEAIERFCQFLQKVVYIDDDLDECFALGMHTKLSVDAPYKRTKLGELVYGAKSYDTTSHKGSTEKADRIAKVMARVIRRHPSFTSVDFIVAVPPSNPDKSFDLPTHIAGRIAEITKIPFRGDFIRKTRKTQAMKDCETIESKVKNIKDAFKVNQDEINGKKVLIIDDIYHSGFTINELGRIIRNADAKWVFGLTATKTSKDY